MDWDFISMFEILKINGRKLSYKTDFAIISQI